MTRGIRNNNPGNIDYNKANKWQGLLLRKAAEKKAGASNDEPR
ncbi:hypothetical protein AB0856_001676 [Xenorhabdus stockiae]